MNLQLTGSDNRGSLVLSSSGGVISTFAYSPFGATAPRTGSAASLPGFNGERADPFSGVTHLGNGYRAYSPALRRFTCPDSESPFGIGGVNPYVYCDSDPINLSDPSGHGPITWLLRKATTLAIRWGMKAAMADSLTAAAAVTANVESGFAIAAGAASAATGIASEATKQSNPEVSQKLKWASLGLGVGSAVFGMGAGAAKVQKGLRGLSGRLGRIKEQGLSGRGATAAGREMAAERNSPLRLRGGGNDETVLYRGDSRSPGTIRSAGGFTPKSGKSASGVRQEYYDKLRSSPDGVARDHVAFKNPDFVSTAVDEQCGGYSSGYIYKIKIPNFNVHKFGPDILGAGANPLRSGRLFPHLMMSGETYSGSELVAIQQPLQSDSPEVSFLTSIPNRYITNWRKGNGNEWNVF